MVNYGNYAIHSTNQSHDNAKLAGKLALQYTETSASATSMQPQDHSAYTPYQQFSQVNRN